jgi:hypothetical protein
MRRLCCLLAFAASLLALSAFAAEPLRVEVGKSRLLSLKQDPAVIMVGDPSVADVVVEEGRRLFLLGLQPGETNLHILDGDGAALMNVRLVVTPPAVGHVSLHRGVEEATLSCNPRCAGVRTPEGTGAIRGSNAPSAAAVFDAARSGAPIGVAPAAPAPAPGQPAAPPAAPRAPATPAGGGAPAPAQ